MLAHVITNTNTSGGLGDGGLIMQDTGRPSNQGQIQCHFIVRPAEVCYGILKRYHFHYYQIETQVKGGCKIMQDRGRASAQGQSRMRIVLKDNYTKVIAANRVNEVMK